MISERFISSVAQSLTCVVNGERVYIRKFDTTDLKLVCRKRYGD